MYGCYSSYYPDRGGYLDESFKVTILILTPTCQRRIMPRPRCVSMCTRLYSPSIISRCEAERCDPIHHSLVVSSAPVRIRRRKSIRLHDSVHNFPSPRSSFEKCAVALAIRLSARLDMILRFALPPDSFSKMGAIASAIVLTTLAPIASRQSTNSSEITIVPARLGSILTRKSFAPPPLETSVGSCWFALFRISCLEERIAFSASLGDGHFTSCTCPIMIGSVLMVLKE